MSKVGLRYTLWVMRPEEADIDPNTMAEILEDAEPQDTTLDAKIQRWLGGTLNEAEEHLHIALPDGWYARIESA